MYLEPTNFISIEIPTQVSHPLPDKLTTLTPTEQQLVKTLYKNWKSGNRVTHQTIADELHKTRGVVRNQVSEIYHKLGVEPQLTALFSYLVRIGYNPDASPN